MWQRPLAWDGRVLEGVYPKNLKVYPKNDVAKLFPSNGEFSRPQHTPSHEQRHLQSSLIINAVHFHRAQESPTPGSTGRAGTSSRITAACVEQDSLPRPGGVVGMGQRWEMQSGTYGLQLGQDLLPPGRGVQRAAAKGALEKLATTWDGQ